MLLGFLLLLSSLLLAPVQTFLVREIAQSYVSGKGGQLELGYVRIGLGGSLSLRELRLIGPAGDTLVDVQSLKTRLRWWKLPEKLQIDASQIGGVRLRVQSDSLGLANYAFLLPTENSDSVVAETSDVYMQLQVGTLTVSNIQLVYADAQAGTDLRLQLDSLFLQTDSLQPETGKYQLTTLAMRGLQLSYSDAGKPSPPSSDTTALPLQLAIKQLQISESQLRISDPASETEMHLGLLQLQLPLLDLAGQKLQVDSLLLADSKLQWREKNTSVNLKEQPTAESRKPTAIWPEWQLQWRGIDLQRNEVQLSLLDSSFGYALGLLQFAGTYRPNYLNTDWQISDFTTHNGLKLAQFAGRLQVNDEKLLLSQLDLRSRESALSGKLEARFPNIDDLMALRESVEIKSNLQLDLLPAEFAMLLGETALDPQIAPLLPLPLNAQLAISGNSRQMQLHNLQMAWAEGTTFRTSGSLQRPLELEKMRLHLPAFQFRSVRNDLALLYTDTALALPSYAMLQGSTELSMRSFKGGLKLLLPEGDALLFVDVQQDDSLRYVANVQLEGESWAKMLKQNDLGAVSLGFRAEGIGVDPSSLTAKMEGRFDQLRYRSEKLDGLDFSGSMNQGTFDLRAGLNQEVLAFELEANGYTDSIRNAIDMRLQLIRAQLHRLGLREEELLARLELEAKYEAQGNDLKARLQLRDALLQDGQSRHVLKQQLVDFNSTAEQSTLLLQGDLASGRAQGNAGWDSLYRQLESVFSHFAIDSISSLALQADLKLHPAADLLGLLTSDSTRLDTLHFGLQADGVTRSITVTAWLPHAEYTDSRIHDLRASGKMEGRELAATLSIHQFQQGDLVQLDSTWFSLERISDTLQFTLGLNQENGQPFYLIAASYLPLSNGFWAQLKPDGLLLQGGSWQVAPENYVSLVDHKIYSQKLLLSREDESLGLKAAGEDALTLFFDGFRLSNLTALLDADSVPLRGALKGSLQLENLFTQPAFVADLQVDRLRLPDLSLGSLQLKATNPTGNRYELDARMWGAGTAFNLSGSYLATAENPQIRMQLQLDTLPIPLLAQLSGGELHEASGHISANLQLTGSPSAPNYRGQLAFNQAAFRLKSTNTLLQLPAERIRVDNAGIYFDKLQLRDSLNNTLALSGKIKTPSILQPELDLKLEADNFQLLNATPENNPYLYGNASINTKASLTGTPAKPIIELDAQLNSGSKLWVVVPESEAALIAREGVVVFIDAYATEFDSLLVPAGSSSLLGLTLRAALTVDPQTELTVIVDERAGDQLVLSGQADLRYELYPNGRQTLTGQYEVSKGAYELSLYQLVKRKFELVPGSTISWQGNPTDAALDLRALYRIKTAPLDLMSEQLSGADASQLTRYRQELPFEVYTRITGELLAPTVAFSIDMPEKQRGAIDGQVYSRVQRLNQQEDELNRQVFSLLVLNRFIPTSTSQLTPNVSATAMARSSASQLLSSQLNSLSSKYVKGVDLNVNLNSFKDYQSGQVADRTVAQVQLQKNLFDERLVVQLGSEVDLEGSRARQQRASDLLGDLSLEYLLNTDGSLRLSAFRRQQFEGVMEGQLIVSGTSLVYSREFNRFAEAFRRRPTPQLQTEPTPEEDKP